MLAEQKRFVLGVEERVKKEIKSLLGVTPITLASGSPRRKEILNLAGVECRIVSPNVDEEIPGATHPEQFACVIAQRKLANIPVSGGITVAADTIVVLGQTILGKPKDKSDAARILRLLSGERHYVVTGMSLRDDTNGHAFTGFERSHVTFQALSEEDIESYIESGEPMDKAGAYGIQGMGELLVERLEGNLDNVIGFPVHLFVRLLKGMRSGV